MNWKPPEMKPLNVKPTERPSLEMLAHLLESEDGQLYGETLSRDEIAMLVNELLILQHGVVELTHQWRGSSEKWNGRGCAGALDELFRVKPC